MRALSCDAIGLSPWYYRSFMAWPSTTCAVDDCQEFAILRELIRGALMSLLHSFSNASRGNLDI
jgi:hypothetical protein